MYLKEKHKKELIQILKDLVSYQSIYKKDSKYPFGLENKKCLDYVLEIGKNYGFKTVNLDDYCGYIEIGKGQELIGVVTHLDVVPAGEGWSTNPFELTQIGNKLYGRGTSDDKGAVAASLIAIKIINDLEIDLTKRIRLIFGCNEESGSKCIKHYIKKEGDFDYGFTPDGDFPLIHGEKGMISGTISGKTNNIININGGTVPNAVANKCTCKIKSNTYNQDKLKEYVGKNNLKIDIITNNDIDTISITGTSAHASTPELGKNAISYLLQGLKISGLNDPFINFYTNNIGTTYDGSKLGINLFDDYGPLTLNIGVINQIKNQITATIDIRFPVTLPSKEILQKLTIIQEKDCFIKFNDPVEPLFYPLDSILVSKLYEAYQEVSKDKTSKPLVIGGGTYAKNMKNCVAFGPQYPNEDNHIHDINEFVEIDKLYQQVDYYITAILKLLEI